MVWIENDVTLSVIRESDRKRNNQLATTRLVQKASSHARLEDMKFRFAHRSLQAQQQPVVEVGGIIHSIFIKDEGVGECADLEQSVPVS
ncbi:MAG: hypothetical protein A3J28_15030 [Acidobacteria bacterium RIFCSPLOWO2_12_FULL_60_22]|nr:MAG: hypothetical protein A3J28_15030 [Acidobacteria bacterium RIFCSPLOWO2_12_FULL_60_22]